MPHYSDCNMTQWEIQLKPQFHVPYLSPLALWQPEVPLGDQGMTLEVPSRGLRVGRSITSRTFAA